MGWRGVAVDAKIPMDDDSLRLIREALDSKIIGEDDEGNLIRTGEFSLSSLLDFWSGYDPALLREVADGVYIYGGTIFSQYDLIRTLVDTIIATRSGVYLAVAQVLEDELDGDLRLDMNNLEENSRFWRLVERVEEAILREPEE